MFNKVVLSMVLLSVLSFDCYADEEEEALQMRPNPMEHSAKKAVMQKNKVIQTRSKASSVATSKRQMLSESEEEELQPKSVIKSNSARYKQTNKRQQQKAKIGAISR